VQRDPGVRPRLAARHGPAVVGDRRVGRAAGRVGRCGYRRPLRRGLGLRLRVGVRGRRLAVSRGCAAGGGLHGGVPGRLHTTAGSSGRLGGTPGGRVGQPQPVRTGPDRLVQGGRAGRHASAGAGGGLWGTGPGMLAEAGQQDQRHRGRGDQNRGDQQPQSAAPAQPARAPAEPAGGWLSHGRGQGPLHPGRRQRRRPAAAVRPAAQWRRWAGRRRRRAGGQRRRAGRRGWCTAWRGR